MEILEKYSNYKSGKFICRKTQMYTLCTLYESYLAIIMGHNTVV